MIVQFKICVEQMKLQVLTVLNALTYNYTRLSVKNFIIVIVYFLKSILVLCIKSLQYS